MKTIVAKYFSSRHLIIRTLAMPTPPQVEREILINPTFTPDEKQSFRKIVDMTKPWPATVPTTRVERRCPLGYIRFERD